MADMTEEILQTIRDTIRETVNGKIDRLSQKLDDHIIQHAQDQKELEPIIIAFKGKSYIYKLLMSYLAPLGLAGGIAAGLAAVVDFLLRVTNHH